MFTRPDLLWALTATALPVVIHLFNRYRAKKKRFAAIDFLVSVKRRTSRKLLLRQILLLIVRTLLIAMLVLVASGPVWNLFQHQKSESPVTMVLIIDRSFSMQAQSGGQSRYEMVLDYTRKMISGLRSGDRMCLIAAGDSIDVLMEPCIDFAGILNERLEDIEPGFGKSNLSRAVEEAASLLASGERRHGRIVVLTDGARHAFPRMVEWPKGVEPPEVVVHIVDRDGLRDNRAVNTVETAIRGNYLEVSARISYFASGKQKEQLLTQVRKGEETLAQGFVDLYPGQTSQKIFSIPDMESGLEFGKTTVKKTEPAKPSLFEVALPGDILTGDNVRLFPAPDLRPVKILLINGDMRQVLHQDELFYVEHALSAANERSTSVLYYTILPEKLDEKILESIDVVFLLNVGDLTRDVASALHEHVSDGGGLFISMGDKTKVDDINEMLADILPCPLRDIIDLRGAGSINGTEKGMAFAKIRLDHPVLSLFEGESAASLQMVRTWRAAVVDPGVSNKSFDVLMRYTNDSPALLESTRQRGRVMLFTSSLDMDWTSWPARASFQPFIQRVAFHLAGRSESATPLEVTVDENVCFRAPEEIDGVRVVGPNGEETSTEKKMAQAREICFQNVARPGWYSIEPEKKNREVRSSVMIPGFIVHPPSQESDLTLVDPKSLRRIMGQQVLHPLSGAGGYIGHKPCWIFLFLAIFLMMLEAWYELREA